MSVCKHGWKEDCCPMCDRRPPFEVVENHDVPPDMMAMATPQGEVVLAHRALGVIRCSCGGVVFRARALPEGVGVFCEACDHQLRASEITVPTQPRATA